jgi:hypothetical protein
MAVDQQLATVRQVMHVQRMLRRHELILMAIVAIQLINLIIAISKV